MSGDAVLRRAKALLGDLRAVEQLSGSLWVVEAGARRSVVKADPGARDEAEGLLAIRGVAGAPPVPAVLAVEDGLLVEEWVAPGPRTPAAEEELGRALARLHAAPWPCFGGGSSWTGRCRVDPSTCADATSFYGARLAALAERCGLAGPVSTVVDRLESLVPPGPPSLVHGDLWWGNVCFASDGRAWLIDPSAHGGHAEEDLGMLALFGEVPSRLLDAYGEIRPPSPGWEERVELFQLLPLLVHAVLFGGGYLARARTIATRYG